MGVRGGSVCVTDVPYAPASQASWGPGLLTFEGVEPMGRGRAKAKQVKVARQLKYNGGGTDLDRLRAELGVGADHDDGAYDPVAADRDDDDAEEEDEEDDEWSAS